MSIDDRVFVDFPKESKEHNIDVMDLIRQYHDITNIVRKQNPQAGYDYVLRETVRRTKLWLDTYHKPREEAHGCYDGK